MFVFGSVISGKKLIILLSAYVILLLASLLLTVVGGIWYMTESVPVTRYYSYVRLAWYGPIKVIRPVSVLSCNMLPNEKQKKT